MSVTPMSDLENRLRSRHKVFDAPNGHPAFCAKTDDEIDAERLAAADIISAVREWAETELALLVPASAPDDLIVPTRRGSARRLLAIINRWGCSNEGVTCRGNQ